MSGKVREGDDLLTADRGSNERIAQIYVVAGGNRVKVEELQAGDIGCLLYTSCCLHYDKWYPCLFCYRFCLR